MTLPVFLHPENGTTCRIDLWVQPRAKQSGWAGMHGQRLKLRIAAPAVDGRANRELVRFLARSLGIAAKNIEIAAGATSRGKSVRIRDTGCEQLLSLLPKIPDPSTG